MNPQHPADTLSGYVDGALTPAEHAGVEEHLATCFECRTVVDDIRALRALLRQEPQVAVPVAALPRTLAVLAERGSRRPWATQRLGVAAAVAAAALVVGLQWPIDPAPGAESARHAGFQGHAEVSLAHPLADMTLVTYLATHLPYDLELGPGDYR